MPQQSQPQPSTITAVVQPEIPDTTPNPIPVSADRIYTNDELLRHSRDGDLWLAIDGTVYDLTAFSDEHPGGTKILVSVAGTDASKKFRKYHGDNILLRYAKEYKIGTLKVEGQRVEKDSSGFFGLIKKKKKK
ncbi:cytochrome b5-like heme/steroid binding domain-containing protein [Aspergillus crustosus]